MSKRNQKKPWWDHSDSSSSDTREAIEMKPPRGVHKRFRRNVSSNSMRDDGTFRRCCPFCCDPSEWDFWSANMIRKKQNPTNLYTKISAPRPSKGSLESAETALGDMADYVASQYLAPNPAQENEKKTSQVLNTKPADSDSDHDGQIATTESAGDQEPVLKKDKKPQDPKPADSVSDRGGFMGNLDLDSRLFTILLCTMALVFLSCLAVLSLCSNCN